MANPEQTAREDQRSVGGTGRNKKFTSGDKLPKGWNWKGDFVVDDRGNVIGRSGEVPVPGWFDNQQQQQGGGPSEDAMKQDQRARGHEPGDNNYQDPWNPGSGDDWGFPRNPPDKPLVPGQDGQPPPWIPKDHPDRRAGWPDIPGERPNTPGSPNPNYPDDIDPGYPGPWDPAPDDPHIDEPMWPPPGSNPPTWPNPQPPKAGGPGWPGDQHPSPPGIPPTIMPMPGPIMPPGGPFLPPQPGPPGPPGPPGAPGGGAGDIVTGINPIIGANPINEFNPIVGVNPINDFNPINEFNPIFNPIINIPIGGGGFQPQPMPPTVIQLPGQPQAPMRPQQQQAAAPQWLTPGVVSSSGAGSGNLAQSLGGGGTGGGRNMFASGRKPQSQFSYGVRS